MAEDEFGAGDSMSLTGPDDPLQRHKPWRLNVLRVARAGVVLVVVLLLLFVALTVPDIWADGADRWSAIVFVVLGLGLAVGLWLVTNRLLFRRIPRRRHWYRRVPEAERPWRVQPARRGGVPRHSKRGY